MKRLVFVGLFLLIAVSMIGVYSFEDIGGGVKDFVGGFISLTGNAILQTDASLDKGFEKIEVPEPTTVAAKEEVVEEKEEVPEKEPVVEEVAVEEVVEEEPVVDSPSSSVDVGDYLPTCSDFIDNNVNYYEKGVCKSDGENYEDYCSDDGATLMEYSCTSSGLCGGSWYVCANSCDGGACLTEIQEVLAPDLKVVSVRNTLISTVVLVRNIGTQGTYFEAKLYSSNEEILSDVDYFLEPERSVEIDLGNKIEGAYSVEIISDEEDSDLSNNVVDVDGGFSEEVSTEITGDVVSDAAPGEDSSFFSKFFGFLRSFF